MSYWFKVQGLWHTSMAGLSQKSLGYPGLNRGDPTAIVPQDHSLQALQQVTDLADVRVDQDVGVGGS